MNIQSKTESTSMQCSIQFLWLSRIKLPFDIIIGTRIKQFLHILIFLLNLLIYSVIVKFSARIAAVFFVFEFVFTKKEIKIKLIKKFTQSKRKKKIQIRRRPLGKSN